MQDHVKAAHFVCFNLGFLPGGDRSVISRPATTVAAVEAAMRILVPRGIISVLAYVGHPGKAYNPLAILVIYGTPKQRHIHISKQNERQR